MPHTAAQIHHAESTVDLSRPDKPVSHGKQASPESYSTNPIYRKNDRPSSRKDRTEDRINRISEIVEGRVVHLGITLLALLLTGWCAFLLLVHDEAGVAFFSVPFETCEVGEFEFVVGLLLELLVDGI